MALARFTITKYGVIELNHVSWPETARVFGQLPLLAADFAEATPAAVAENGMWLVYDIAAGAVRLPDDTTEPVGVLYMGEKEYNKFEVGLNQFFLDSATGFLPRIGMPMVGDIYTTNTFCYDVGSGTGQFANNAAVVSALGGNLVSAPLYLIPSAGGAPRITNAAGLAAAISSPGVSTIARVVKYYTLPDGNPAIKVQFTQVA